MSRVNVPEAWQHVGSTSNAEFYRIAADILAIVPHDNTTDDERTARESLAFQDRYWRSAGHRGAVVCFMEPVLSQDAGARAVYANETHQSLSTCFALVSETLFAHAQAAVFTGLARPGIPTQIFRSLDDARGFIEEMNERRGGAVAG